MTASEDTARKSDVEWVWRYDGDLPAVELLLEGERLSRLGEDGLEIACPPAEALALDVGDWLVRRTDGRLDKVDCDAAVAIRGAVPDADREPGAPRG